MIYSMGNLLGAELNKKHLARVRHDTCRVIQRQILDVNGLASNIKWDVVVDLV